MDTGGRGVQCVIWRFCDAKRGHENQSAGLVEALADRHPVIVHDLAARGALPPNRLPLPDPTLIIGAGHATHRPMLSARRARGGRVIVLMRPSLPRRCFDLCIIPEHDGVKARADTLITRGVLNRVRPGAGRTPDAGLILIGGPSQHYDWDDAALIAQIASLARDRAPVRWRVADSRRTPSSLLPAVANLGFANIETIPLAAVTPDWLPARLAEASEVWVSEDSVLMVYEALSGGAAVGVLEVPARKRRCGAAADRVRSGLDMLVRQGLVTRLAARDPAQPLAVPCAPLNEARRCADWIIEHWLDHPS